VSKEQVRRTGVRRSNLIYAAMLLIVCLHVPTQANLASLEAHDTPLVVRVSGPISRLITAGEHLPRDQNFQLGPTDQVTLLEAKGTRVVTGPGILKGEEFKSGLMVRKRADRSSLGGVRGGVLEGDVSSPSKAAINDAAVAEINQRDPR
jgi:hypothetical protein